MFLKYMHYFTIKLKGFLFFLSLPLVGRDLWKDRASRQKFLKYNNEDFLSGPVVKTPHSQCTWVSEGYYTHIITKKEDTSQV